MKPWSYIAGGVGAVVLVVLGLQLIDDRESATQAFPVVAEPAFSEFANPDSVDLLEEKEAEAQTTRAQNSAESEVEPIPDTASQPRDSDRQAVGREAAFSGFVVDADGLPIEGAVVSWSPIADEVMDPYAPFLSLTDFVDRNTAQVSSDADGAFAFDSEPSIMTENGSVVWITHTRFAPRFVHLGSNSNSWTHRSRYELASAKPEIANVVDQVGAGVAGATVRQVAYSDSSSNESDEGLAELVYLLNREVTTGPDGTCERHIFPGWQQVSASLARIIHDLVGANVRVRRMEF